MNVRIILINVSISLISDNMNIEIASDILLSLSLSSHDKEWISINNHTINKIE